MSSENISNWKYQNTQRSRDMLAEYLAGTKGIADAWAVDRLIADNERRGYLAHAARIGATFGSVADVLAMQMDGATPIEDDGPHIDAKPGEMPPDRPALSLARAIIEVAIAVKVHSAAIDRLAAVVEKATDRPIRVETQY